MRPSDMGKSYRTQATVCSGTPVSTEFSINNATPTSILESRDGNLIPKTMEYEGHPSGSFTFAQNDENEIPVPLFLKLPAEIRVRIYSYLLHAYSGIYIHTIDADSPEAPKGLLRCRFPDRECSSKSMEFGKYTVEATGIHPAILSVNRQTYLEASKLLYAENCFKFSSGNAPIIPFLEDRSEGSRRLIKQIEFCHYFYTFSPVKLQDYIHLDHIFESICSYLSKSLQLEHVTLRFFGLSTPDVRNSTSYKDYLSNIDKQSWVQQLVPLLKHLKTFKAVGMIHCDNNLVLAAQPYLKSKMDRASKRVR